jgi:hypothetical protein
MEFTFRTECWIKFLTQLAEVICPYNYYILYYPLPYRWVRQPDIQQNTGSYLFTIILFLILKENKQNINTQCSHFAENHKALSKEPLFKT